MSKVSRSSYFHCKHLTEKLIQITVNPVIDKQQQFGTHRLTELITGKCQTAMTVQKDTTPCLCSFLSGSFLVWVD